MKTKVVPMREYPQEIEETVQKINKCLNISLFDWQIGYIFYNKPLPKEISFARRAGKTLAAALRMCVSKAEPIYLRRRDIALEGTETYRVLSYFADEDVLEEHFDAKHLIKQTSNLTADNGDKAYGTCEDYITLLSCEQYRKYRDYVPLFEECMWTLTPWRCDTGSAYIVRSVNPTGVFSISHASISNGLAPVCLFNSDNLTLRRQAQLISAE